MFKKHIVLALTVCVFASLLIIPSKALATGSGTNPPPNYGTFIIDEDYQTFPWTVDPANCYDSASGECIFNSMETLIFTLGERYDMFMPMLATQVTVAQRDLAAPAYTNFTVYFKIRGVQSDGTGTIPFHNRCRVDSPATWNQYYLTTTDVQYSLQRFLVHDYIGAATSMFYEPLLDCHAGNPGDSLWGTKIDNAIQKNNTHVWINCANPGLTVTPNRTFAPVNMFVTDDGSFDANFYANTANLPLDYSLTTLMQVLCQPPCSIMNKQWVMNYVNTALPPHAGAPYADWDGNVAQWALYTGWGSDQSPEDKLPLSAPTPGVMCGTGPYVLDYYDAANGWSSVKYDLYYKPWPAHDFSPPYPSTDPTIVPSGIYPAGYVNRIIVNNNRILSNRVSEMISGQCDVAVVSKASEYGFHTNSRNGPTLDGIRLNYPIPTLQLESNHYTFLVDPAPANYYGIINANDTLSEYGIPANFFSNPHVRLAFTYLTNYTYCIKDLMFNEAYQPYTCAPGGLPYVNPSNPMYGPDPNITAAKAQLDLATFGGVALSARGFTVQICYCDMYGSAMVNFCLDLVHMVNKLGTDFGLPYHANPHNVEYLAFYSAVADHMCPVFPMGWTGDCAMQDWLFAYAHSQGFFGSIQRYHNATIDALLDQAARMPDGSAKQNLYYQAELMLYQDNPTTFLYVPIERGYTRAWDNGFGVEYNPVYPGVYARYVWKWIYYRGDINYDGHVNMGDVGPILDAFGSNIGMNGMPVILAKWNFHCDVDGNPYESYPIGDGGWRDRKIDMYDVSATLADFGKSSATWKIVPKVTPASGGSPVLLTCTATGGNPAAYTYQWFLNNVLISGATSSTYTATGAGKYACQVSDGVQISISNNATIT